MLSAAVLSSCSYHASPGMNCKKRTAASLATKPILGNGFGATVRPFSLGFTFRTLASLGGYHLGMITYQQVLCFVIRYTFLPAQSFHIISFTITSVVFCSSGKGDYGFSQAVKVKPCRFERKSPRLH
jgi:hypothetical protein